MIRAEVTVRLFDDEEELGSAMQVVRSTKGYKPPFETTIILSDIGYAAMIACRAANALKPSTKFFPT